MIKKRLPLTACLLLAACVSPGEQTYKRYIDTKRIPQPTIAQFPHCHDYGCIKHDLIEFDKRTWKKIDKFFYRKSKNAAQERKRIEKVIGKFETIVGALAGTDVDIQGTFVKMGNGQLDCVDESTNTTIYLALLKQRGHLKFHAIEQPSIRLPFVGGGWMHQTAVIREIKTEERFAVDSWFKDNGAPAIILPLSEWQSGWRPPEEEEKKAN